MAASQDKLDVGRMFVIGAGGIIFTYAIVVFLEALYLAKHEAEVERKVMVAPYSEALESEAAGAEHLASYGWLDQEAGTVHIPLEKARAAFLEQPR